MVEKIQNLALNQKIVNEDGTPTMYFLRLLQDRGIISQGAATDADSALTIAQAAQADVDALELRNINTGTGLAGGGNLTADRTLTLNAGINLLTDVDTSTTPPTVGQALVWDNVSSLWKPGTVSGGGGGGGEWTPLTFSGVSSTKWGGLASWKSDQSFSLATGNIIEVEAVIDRAAGAAVSIMVAPNSNNCVQVVRQADNNYVLYYYTTSGGSSVVIEGGTFNSVGPNLERFLLRCVVGSSSRNNLVSSVDYWKNLKLGTVSDTNLPLNGSTSNVWVQPNGSISNILLCRYRKIT